MTSSSAGRPRGRDQVRSAVLTAASELVAERGPDRFSVRDIAERAGVNHALVHRHFGTKADVMEQMLAADARVVVDAILGSGLPTDGEATPSVVADLLDLLAARPSYWRTLVQAVLDSPEAALPGTASTTALFSDLWAGGDADRATSTSVAGITALGWLIFGPFMAESTGADPADVRRAVAEQMAALLTPPS
ncbi:transcriptional regulator, TetR family [Aeromicrobium marinum DSM 15272]|uniref:Transcriptional regulator, TetR family n=1 Tax=Aeromicrobium marinum DSM 15272 TaxID=585531 RepID=E2SEQ0_9ACTN|nr:TetR/AcrR family transcriptional regulator [Aeromicrobium marinum]EFQ82347.1 transcriptional regulator, TetR family [Aeromicrobium marinum DSM 15272]